MYQTSVGLGLLESFVRAKSHLSLRTPQSRLNFERLCLALGAAQAKLIQGRLLSRADKRLLALAIEDWENEGGRLRALE